MEEEEGGGEDGGGYGCAFGGSFEVVFEGPVESWESIVKRGMMSYVSKR